MLLATIMLSAGRDVSDRSAPRTMPPLLPLNTVLLRILMSCGLCQTGPASDIEDEIILNQACVRMVDAVHPGTTVHRIADVVHDVADDRTVQVTLPLIGFDAGTAVGAA